MKELLKAIVKEEGREILLDPDRLRAALARRKAPRGPAEQLLLLLRCGNLADFIAAGKTALSAPELGLIAEVSGRQTGLRPDVVCDRTADVLYALEMPCLSAPPPPPEPGHPPRARAFLPYYVAKRDLDLAAKREQEGDPAGAAEIYHRLADAGVGEAFYRLAMQEATAMAESPEASFRELEYLGRSAGLGCVAANSRLGDVYFRQAGGLSSGKGTAALSHYAAAGASGLGETQRDNMRALLSQRRQNGRLLAAGGVFLIVLLAFFLAFPAVFGLRGFWPWKISLTLLAAGSYALNVWYHATKPYDTLQYTLFQPLFLCAAVYACRMAVV